MNGKKILVVGSSNMDLAVQVKSIARVGETVMGLSKTETPGGKGANQAFACARLGGEVTFLSAVGRDNYGDTLLENMNGAGVAVSHVRRCADTATGTAFISINAEGNNSIVVLQGANSCCDRAYILAHRDLIAQSELVLTQLEIPLDAVFETLAIAHQLGKRTILNPAPACELIPDEVLRLLDYITPNETELEALTGRAVTDEQSAWQAARLLLEKGVGQVIVTLGAKGAMLATPDECIVFPVEKVTVADTVAAGDTFNGALATALCAGDSPAQCIRFANAASTISVSRKGAQASVPTRQEVLARLERLSTLQTAEKERRLV